MRARLPLAALVGATAALPLSAGRAFEAPPAGDVLVNSLGMRMVPVPAGRFQMGSPPGAPMRQEEERLRRVTLSRAFRISATEVTQQQWLALMPAHRSPEAGADRPVTSVSWRDAVAFCQKLSETERATYRLPTEAEWEYACRAGGGDPGVVDSERDAVAWYADNSEGTAHPVGLKKANAWGLHDMLGNVAEWTLDVYGPYPRIEEEEDPRGPATGSTRVVRGGAWRSFPPALRCAARTGTPESYQLAHVGIRVVLEVGPTRAVDEHTWVRLERNSKLCVDQETTCRIGDPMSSPPPSPRWDCWEASGSPGTGRRRLSPRRKPRPARFPPRASSWLMRKAGSRY